jgi:hypothetical protein
MLLHRWSRWEVVHRFALVARDMRDPEKEEREIGTGFIQERECSTCGTRQIRKSVLR